jgi:hypothetical protein
MELRRLQGELKEQVSENTCRKEKLKELAIYHRGWEQYNSVLDALSKQIEVDFLKRYVSTLDIVGVACLVRLR